MRPAHFAREINHCIVILSYSPHTSMRPAHFAREIDALPSQVGARGKLQ